MFNFLAELFAFPLTFFYEITGNYAIAIMLITLLVMAVTTPLTLKSTKGMLEMQKLQPEMRKLQQQHKGDRQTLNAEMMKLYQEHKVNPLASCLPLLLQMPVFFGMFTLLRGLTSTRDPVTNEFLPKFIRHSSRLYEDLSTSTTMTSFGLDLALSPVQMVKENALKGAFYVSTVVLLGFMYWFQQRMIANRSATATMSPVQAKIMQYLPVAFAPINLFFQFGLVIYYVTQTLLRIGQQTYITRRFYGGDHSLGRQAQAASKEARELGKADKAAPPATKAAGKPATKPTAKPAAKPTPNRSAPAPKPIPTRAATPPKGKPTPARATTPQKPTKPVKPARPVKPKPQNPAS